MTLQIDRRVEVPMNEVALLELVGLVFDTGMIPVDKFEDRLWTSLDEINRYFYETIMSLRRRRNKDRLYKPFK